jgi:hypothetical protein
MAGAASSVYQHGAHGGVEGGIDPDLGEAVLLLELVTGFAYSVVGGVGMTWASTSALLTECQQRSVEWAWARAAAISAAAIIR